MKHYTARFSNDFGYADVPLEAETLAQALEKARDMRGQIGRLEPYEDHGDIAEIEVFAEGESAEDDPSAGWSSDVRLLQINAPATAAERDRLRAITTALREAAEALHGQIEGLKGVSRVIDEDILPGNPFRMLRAALAHARKEG